VERADRYLEGISKDGISKAEIGVILVGHGQPEAWDKIYPTQTTQEDSFRQLVRQRFIDDGYPPENIALAWMEFKVPLVKEVARQFAQRPIRRLLVCPVSISAPAIHSEIQIPQEVEKANLPAEIKVVNLGAWGEDPLLVAAIREKIELADPALRGEHGNSPQ
jgi:sirohydrochlorin ferrochelatase